VTDTSLRGRLLVSTPGLSDPNFDRTVVLVLEHDGDGALGLVLNRPSATPLHEVLPTWQGMSSDPPLVFVGGPVDESAAICLGSCRPGATSEAIQVVTPTVGVVDLDTDPGLLTHLVAHVRVFSGYAGWGAGQLDDEVEAGGWFVVDALPGDPFTPSPAGLWRAVLRRQPGRLPLYSTFPDDPTHN
jgi:putative transcriptional regulator